MQDNLTGLWPVIFCMDNFPHVGAVLTAMVLMDSCGFIVANEFVPTYDDRNRHENYTKTCRSGFSRDGFVA
jgi:hypothetical protein